MSEHILHFNRKRNYRRIGKDKVVRLRYLLSDRLSRETLAFRDDMYYLHGGYGSAFPKVEQALEGLEVDMKISVDLDPHEGYGEPDPRLQMRIPRAELPAEAQQLGAILQGESENGGQRDFRVVAVEAEDLLVDGNHPMAGRKLRFEFEVLDIRDASAAEIAAGYGFAQPPEDSN